MSPYPFDTIRLNHREVKIEEILSGAAFPQTMFEEDALDFIKDWLNGVDSFSIQTSGTTGAPKTIVVRREQMQHQALSSILALALQPGDVALACLPVKYIAGKMMLVRALTNRMKLEIVEPSSNPLEKIHLTQKIDFAAFVPLQLQTMIEGGLAKRLNEIKCIIIGGAAVNPSLKQRIENELTTSVFVTYGMTETLTHIALQPLTGTESRDVFTTLPGITIKTDDRGCLVITAPYLVDDVVTNDLVHITGKNSFRWLGRIDNVINSGGIKIIPEQVEAIVDGLFREMNITRRFFVAGRPDNRLGECVCLYMEGEQLPQFDEKSLLEKFSTHLSHYQTPKDIVYISKFKETETGKVIPNGDSDI